MMNVLKTYVTRKLNNAIRVEKEEWFDKATDYVDHASAKSAESDEPGDFGMYEINDLVDTITDAQTSIDTADEFTWKAVKGFAGKTAGDAISAVAAWNAVYAIAIYSIKNGFNPRRMAVDIGRDVAINGVGLIAGQAISFTSIKFLRNIGVRKSTSSITDDIIAELEKTAKLVSQLTDEQRIAVMKIMELVHDDPYDVYNRVKDLNDDSADEKRPLDSEELKKADEKLRKAAAFVKSLKPEDLNEIVTASDDEIEKVSKETTDEDEYAEAHPEESEESSEA